MVEADIVSSAPLTYLYSSFQYQLLTNAGHMQYCRNKNDLSSHPMLPFNRLRRLLRQAETLERRRLRTTIYPPVRFTWIYRAHRVRHRTMVW